ELSFNYFKTFRIQSSNIEPNNLLTLNVSVYVSPKSDANMFSVYRETIFREKLINYREYVINILNKYINNSANKIYKTSAKNILNQLEASIDSASIIFRESERLQKEYNFMQSYYDNNKYLSLPIHKVEYPKVISSLCRSFEMIYTNEIIGDSDYYKNVILRDILNNTCCVNTNILYIACLYGHIEIVIELLKHPRIDVNRTTAGVTPLCIACGRSHAEVVIELLKHPRIDVNKTTNAGTTPLYAACVRGHTEVVIELLKHSRIDVNKATNAGVTPLYIACERGHTEVVIELLKHPRIDVNRTTAGATPFYIACERGHTEVVELLLKQRSLATDDSSVASYFIGGCSMSSNNQILDSLKIHFWKHNINTPCNFRQENGTVESLTPLIQGCRFINNRSIKWLLNNYRELNNATIFENMCALRWYQTKKNKRLRYDIDIEKRLKLLLK
ncbi:ankyrin repeat domain-containing protein, partial [Allofrancisella guangzhouensis]|uniref:ankyrin repeat domain-containing protein n=1 Tax=Allofrancisella guangzhouensis TaxID=594679 RepID=UPI001F30307D